MQQAGSLCSPDLGAFDAFQLRQERLSITSVKPGERILGVEGGGTKTAWALVERDGDELRVLDQGKLPPSNLRLTTPERLRAIFSELPKQINRAGVFLAGCSTDEDRQSLTRICTSVWPNAKVVTGSDRDSGFAAALGRGSCVL